MTSADRTTERLRAEPLVRQPHPHAAPRAAACSSWSSDDGIRGVTSNPTIFDKAIAGGEGYDDAAARAAPRQGVDRGHVLGRSCRRHRCAAPTCCARSTTRSTGGDGFVSIEVSPLLAHDTEGTIEQAAALFERLDRPNVMIKIPATLEGIPAIEETIAAGHQRERHADLLPRPPRRGDRGVPHGARALRRRPAATCRRRQLGGVVLREPGRHRDRPAPARGLTRCAARPRWRTPSSPTRCSARRSRARAGRRSRRRARSCSGRCGRRRRPRTRPTPPRSTSTTLIGPDTVNTLAPASIDALHEGDATMRADTVAEDVDGARQVMTRPRRRRRRLRRRHRDARARRRRLVRRVVQRPHRDASRSAPPRSS